MIDAIRREITRAFAQARFALRAVSTGLQIATRIQRVNAEGLAGEQLQDMELFQHFGFTSAPPAGHQMIVIPLGGRTSASVVVATEHGTYRFQLGAEGEAALYNQWGDVVHMRQDRTIHMVAQVQVLVDAPLLKVNGMIHATGDITSDTDVIDQAAGVPKTMRNMRATFNGHDHADPQGGVVGHPNQTM